METLTSITVTVREDGTVENIIVNRYKRDQVGNIYGFPAGADEWRSWRPHDKKK